MKSSRRTYWLVLLTALVLAVVTLGYWQVDFIVDLANFYGLC